MAPAYAGSRARQENSTTKGNPKAEGRDPKEGRNPRREFYSNWSTLAARIKSLSVRPLILCVQMVSFTLPQDR